MGSPSFLTLLIDWLSALIGIKASFHLFFLSLGSPLEVKNVSNRKSPEHDEVKGQTWVLALISVTLSKSHKLGVSVSSSINGNNITYLRIFLRNGTIC